MLDFISTGSEAAQIDRATIGGTWGTATSELMKGVWEPQPEVKEALRGCDLAIRAQDTLMANYVVHYFNRLSDHLKVIAPKLSGRARLAYVVGNSSIKGQYVETDLILARLMEALVPDLSVSQLHRFRKRHSGIDLYETVVYGTKVRS